MKDTTKNIKAFAFDWVSKILMALVLWVVKDMHADLKNVLATIPAMRVEIDNLKDQRLLDRFKIFKYPMKNEEIITLDSLTKQQ